MEPKTGNKKIESLLANFFGIDVTSIQYYYKLIQESYNRTTINAYDGFIIADKFENVSFQSEDARRNWSNAGLIGIDLPLYFENNSDNAKSKTIAIVGIDPLRKRKDFERIENGKIIIGTPYAFHSTYYRNCKGRTKIYFDFVTHIFNSGYNVYLTDIFKIWMNDSATSLYQRYYLRNEKKSFQTLLSGEFTEIRPSKILAFGGDAYRSCKKLLADSGFNYGLTKFTHPSGAANGKWKDKLGDRFTLEDKLQCLNNEFDNGQV